MFSHCQNWFCSRFASAVTLALFCSTLTAAEYVKPPKGGQYNAKDQTVEMFAAIEKGDIAVKLIPKDSTQCRVMIENKTDKPLNVKLPEAFAGVPVLAQVNNPMGGNNNNNQMQGMGGGMGGMGGGGMGGGGMQGGGGGGFFNVAPEKVGQFKVATVCLEHGKAEPKPVAYQIKPLDSFTTKPGVRELCQALSAGQIGQRAAQAATWHLNNDMSWEQLAAKRLRFANGTSQPYFTQQEIQGGMQVAALALKVAEERQKLPNTGSSASAGIQK
jgi:uncharacterized membrane protein YgcG